MSVKFIRVTNRDTGLPVVISINKIVLVEQQTRDNLVIVFDGIDQLREIPVIEKFDEVLIQLDGE